MLGEITFARPEAACTTQNAPTNCQRDQVARLPSTAGQGRDILDQMPRNDSGSDTASGPELRLYTADRCPYAARARITLAEKGLSYERVEIDLSNRPAFMFEKNPTGTVPVLEEDDGFVLPESRAIIEYLEERFPDPPLLPDSVQERARVRVTLDRFERFSSAYYAWRYRNGPAEKFQRQLELLDRRLEGGSYLVGSELTLADVGYVPWILRAEKRGVPLRRLEHLAAWLDRLSARPSIAAEAEAVARLQP
jgi:glutathione S-transferase